MSVQFKYSMMDQFPTRGLAVLLTVLMNLGLYLYRRLQPEGQGTAVIFSWLIFSGILILCVVTDTKAIGNLYGSPQGYLSYLTPVPSWKIVLPRAVCMFFGDVICFCVAMAGTLLVSRDFYYWLSLEELAGLLPLMVWGFIFYLQVVMAFFLGMALARSLFSNKRIGGILSIGAGVLALYVTSLLDYALIPLADDVHRIGSFTYIEISYGLYAGCIAYMLLTAFRLLLFLAATHYFMERKINL